MKKNTFVLSIIALLLAVIPGCYQNQGGKSKLEGEPMPSFDILLKDSSTSLNTLSIPTGKPSVLCYFGTHCPYSRTEMQDIVDNIDKFKDVHLYIFTTDKFQAMKEFYNHYQLDKYPNITMGLDSAGTFGKYISAMGVPYTAIYTKDKKLQKLYTGKIKASLITDAVMQ